MKNLTMVLFLIAFLSVNNLFAQTNKVISMMEPGRYQKDWQLYSSHEFASIFYKYSDCSDPANGFYPEYILFKVQNKTTSKIYLHWEFASEYDGVQGKSAPDENLVQVQLEANQSLEGDCRNLAKTKLGLFVRLKDHGQKMITDFKLIDLKETKLN
jgi:hypothetical protein